ncbi:MAG TPA: carboxymuconolactone decarboxylase family protein [Bacillales bacterium]|nr:carboxymuconolactone decarboxylase family protein [Bacillales bacterium]
MELTAEQRGLRERFIDTFGYWHELWNDLLAEDPVFFEAYVNFGGVPWKRNHLPPKVKEFMHIAVDVAATHMYEPGVREHISNALKLGATKAEIMEVFELTSTLGIHACNCGVPILVDELEKTGVPLDRNLSERQEQLKQEFTDKRGYWNPFWDDLLVLDTDFFASYIHFSSIPWEHGVLEPKVKELVYTAFDVASTHMFAPGLRQHIRNALACGATKEEVMDVIAIASTLGIHGCHLGVPILVDEWKKRDHE